MRSVLDRQNRRCPGTVTAGDAGVAIFSALMVTLVVFMIASLLMTAMVSSQQATANEMRSQEAQSVAEAGLAQAIYWAGATLQKDYANSWSKFVAKELYVNKSPRVTRTGTLGKVNYEFWFEDNSDGDHDPKKDSDNLLWVYARALPRGATLPRAVRGLFRGIEPPAALNYALFGANGIKFHNHNGAVFGVNLATTMFANTDISVDEGIKILGQAIAVNKVTVDAKAVVSPAPIQGAPGPTAPAIRGVPAPAPVPFPKFNYTDAKAAAVANGTYFASAAAFSTFYHNCALPNVTCQTVYPVPWPVTSDGSAACNAAKALPADWKTATTTQLNAFKARPECAPWGTYVNYCWLQGMDKCDKFKTRVYDPDGAGPLTNVPIPRVHLPTLGQYNRWFEIGDTNGDGIYDTCEPDWDSKTNTWSNKCGSPAASVKYFIVHATPGNSCDSPDDDINSIFYVDGNVEISTAKEWVRLEGSLIATEVKISSGAIIAPYEENDAYAYRQSPTRKTFTTSWSGRPQSASILDYDGNPDLDGNGVIDVDPLADLDGDGSLYDFRGGVATADRHCSCWPAIVGKDKLEMKNGEAGVSRVTGTIYTEQGCHVHRSEVEQSTMIEGSEICDDVHNCEFMAFWYDTEVKNTCGFEETDGGRHQLVVALWDELADARGIVPGSLSGGAKTGADKP